MILRDTSVNSYSFYKAVKGRKFRVDIIADAQYVLNKKSHIWKTKHLITYLDAYKYIKQCIDNDQIDDIGDMINTANAYYLTEI